jgi:peptidoglycan/LPS O-acetylase OafA/YrhL
MTPGTHEASRPRYQMLDVWRGVVCLYVVLEHAGVALWQCNDLGSGWVGKLHQAIVGVLALNIGTPLFFVMSGYCIASSLDSAQRRGTAPVAFLARRIWRILPTYWAALFGFVVLVLGLDAFGLTRLHQSDVALEIGSPRALNVAQWLGNLTLTETWRPLVGGGESAVFTRVAWSLCYQEQFYVVCVLALWLAPRRLARALAAATVAIVLFRVMAWDSGSIGRMEGTFPVRWHEFAVGLLVFHCLNGTCSPLARRMVELGLVALALIGCKTELVSTAAAASFGLMLIAMHRWDQQAGQLSWLEPLRACGRRSYSIYLVHLPVTTVCNPWLYDLGLTSFWARLLVLVPIVILASVAVGWAFHRAVESRFLGMPPFLGTLTAKAKPPISDAMPGLLPALAPRPVLILVPVLGVYGSMASAIARARSRSSAFSRLAASTTANFRSGSM